MNEAHAVLDRAGAERDRPEILEQLRAETATRVLPVRAGRAPLSADGLRLYPATDPAFAGDDVEWALLGRRADGTAVLLAALDRDAALDHDGSWADVRDAAARLSPEETELLVSGAALSGWLREAPFCPACGTRAQLRQAGWSRRCPACGREHFPRTDPAVIVAVESADGDRLLLGANANWRGAFYSCFAGFVEAGESLETTVHREILEEAGVRLRDLRYRSSQPWPYPRSLMIGFRATAVDESAALGDGTEIIDVRWLTRGEVGSALAGDGPVGLPGPASIARALIRDWYEERA
ncbi:NAD(+) diphosphatase [Streptomyces sp. MS2A]|nr:NAD(+) diphosphatase [Streptomyces sp. MS2A]